MVFIDTDLNWCQADASRVASFRLQRMAMWVASRAIGLEIGPCKIESWSICGMSRFLRLIRMPPRKEIFSWYGHSHVDLHIYLDHFSWKMSASCRWVATLRFVFPSREMPLFESLVFGGLVRDGIRHGQTLGGFSVKAVNRPAWWLQWLKYL